MDEDFNDFMPSLLHPRCQRKPQSTFAKRSSNKIKHLSLLNLHSASDPERENKDKNHHATRQPLQTLQIENNIIQTKSNETFKFVNSIKNLNTYHKNLVSSLENQNDMPPKKKTGISSKMKNSTPKISVKKQKNTMQNYFKSTVTKHNDTLDTSLKDKIKEMCYRNTKLLEPLNTTEPIIDLCNSSNSSHSPFRDDSTNYSLSQKEPTLSKEINESSNQPILADISLPSTRPNSCDYSIPESKGTSSQHENTSTKALNNSTSLPSVRSNSCDYNIPERKDMYLHHKNTKALDNRLSAVFSGQKRQKKKCPAYKIVKDTPFAVDAFSYGDLPDIQIYFLTHFHSDHYMGLNKSFNKPIFCTKITGDLCQQKLYVQLTIINILEVGKTVDICGIKVTTVDANHCPGSVMLVFSLPCGRNILHCGDFRASPLMESYPVFWNKEIHTVYLDTTYCNPRYNFPTQNESINQAISILRVKEQKMIESGKQFSQLLIVCGTYTIGKENFFMGIANEFKIEIWASSDKDRVLKVALGKSFGSKPPQNCQLHVLPMMKLQYEFLDNYLKNMSSFIEVIAFKPSGWELARGSLIQRGNVTIHGIPYSEHSSFPELQRFIKFLQPKGIIPTVPGNGGCEKMQKYFSCWVGDGEETQKRVSDYFTVQK